MINLKCYSTPKSRVYRKVKFDIAATGGLRAAKVRCAEKEAGKTKWKQVRQ